MNHKLTSSLLYPALLLCFVVLLQACSKPKPGIYKNDKIASGMRDKMHDLNAELLLALKDDHPERLENLVSKDLIDDRATRMKMASEIFARIKKAEYSLMTEYHIVNQPGLNSGTNVIRERDLGINNYDLTFSRGSDESYVALFIPKASPQQFLITAIYEKFDYGWKITKLEINPYAENGKTAPELLELAKQQIANGYFLDGSNSASYAENCLRPYTNWQYVNEKEIYNYNATALTVVSSHYKLPLTMTEVATHPRVWRVRVERTKEGAFPNINYLSNIALLDTMALRKENEAVGKAIGKIFNGIDKDKKYIYYTIYNETTKGIPFRDHYDLVQKLQ